MNDKARRKFLIDGIKGLGATFSALVIGNSIFLPRALATEDKFTATACGELSSEARKILIVYASEYGSTAQVAAGIARTLCERGCRVDVKWIKSDVDVNQYDAVIVGGAIHYDTWMSEAKKFLTSNSAVLSKRPVAYFFTCLTLSIPTDKNLHKAAGYAEKISLLVPAVKPVAVGGFAGALDYKKMSYVVRLTAKSLLSIFGAKEGDFRDWSAIETWAISVDLALIKR